MRFVSATGDIGRRASADLGWVMVVSGMLLSLPTDLSLPARADADVLFTISGGLVVTTAARFLPWERWSRRWLLAWPVTQVTGVVLAAVLSPRGSASTLAGLITIAFLYIGVTQTQWTGVGFLPVGAAALVVSYGGWSHTLAVRWPITLGVWIIVAEALAWLRHQVQRLAAALQNQALTDSLTGLASRRALDLRLATLTDGDAVAFIDLDHFKAVNDERGHAAGDSVLADLGAALRSVVREADLAARFGGEEFLLVLAGARVEGALTALERLEQRWKLLQPEVTFSAGIAVVGPHGDATAAVAAADRALYTAKVTGRNRWQVAPGPRLDDVVALTVPPELVTGAAAVVETA